MKLVQKISFDVDVDSPLFEDWNPKLNDDNTEMNKHCVSVPKLGNQFTNVGALQRQFVVLKVGRTAMSGALSFHKTV